MTIEWLLHWAYAREKVHLARPLGMGASLRGRLGCGGDSSAGIGGGGGGSNMGFEAPFDAYVVERAVSERGSMAMTLRRFAIMGVGAHPDWTPQPKIWVEPGASGNALHLAKNGKRHICPFRMFSYRGDLPAIVEERRRAYGAWAAAVRAVQARLAASGDLAAHGLLADVPALAPWISSRSG